MDTKRKILLPCLMSLMILTLVAGTAMAQTEVQVSYSWTAPTAGSPVDHYVVEHSIDGGSWAQVASVATNSYALTASVGHSHRIRVAAVDASSRQSVYSVASDAYTPDLGAPSQPGKPIIF